MRSVSRLATPLLLLAGVAATTGCPSHTRTVPRTHLPAVVLDATLAEIVQQLDARFNAIQTLSANIEISGITGGGLEGKESESLSLGGYLFVRKPEDLHIYLKVPIVSSLAVDMASDGKTFKLYVPSKHMAVVGSNQVTTLSKKGYENLRPDVFLDSLLIHGMRNDQLASMTLDTHLVDNTAQKKGDLIEEPEYQLSILATPKGREVHTLRVLHIGRENLLPYKQEIYNDAGQIVTRATFSNYQTFGEIRYPTRIVIERPLDHYSLNLGISRLVFNGKIDDEQFEMKIPDGVPIQTLK